MSVLLDDTHGICTEVVDDDGTLTEAQVALLAPYREEYPHLEYTESNKQMGYLRELRWRIRQGKVRE